MHACTYAAAPHNLRGSVPNMNDWKFRYSLLSPPDLTIYIDYPTAIPSAAH